MAGRLKRIIPGDPDKSVFLKRIMLPTNSQGHMPADGTSLSADEKATLTEWITNMKPDPRTIVKTACARCHTGERAAGGLDLSTPAGMLKEVKPGDPAHSNFFARVLIPQGESGHMPKGGPSLSADDTAVLKSWIVGMPDVTDLLKSKCGQCHMGDHPAGELDLMTLTGAMKGLKPGDPASSDILKRVKLPASDAAHMPAGGGGSLSPAEISKLEKWISYLSTVSKQTDK
jgi:hypothetical protein